MNKLIILFYCCLAVSCKTVNYHPKNQMPGYGSGDPKQEITEQDFADTASDFIVSCMNGDETKNGYCFCLHGMFVRNIKKAELTTVEDIIDHLRLVYPSESQRKSCKNER